MDIMTSGARNYDAKWIFVVFTDLSWAGTVTGNVPVFNCALKTFTNIYTIN